MTTTIENIGKPTDFEFCPDQEASYLALFNELPPGRAFGTRPFTFDLDTNIKKFMHGIAGTWANLELAVCNALNEWFCFTAVDDLDAWSADYGIPDECDLYNQSLCAKVQASAPPTTGRLMALLEDSGYVGAGRWVTGSDPQYPGVYSTFKVTIDPLLSPAYLEWSIVPFPLGDRHFGEPSIDEVQCMLQRYVPAHCAVDVELGANWEPVAGLGTDLIAYFDSIDTVDGAVSTWTDRVLGIAATNTGAARPVSALVAPGFDGNSYRFLSFDGTQFLNLATLTGLRNGTAAGEVWSVVSQDSTDVLRQAISYGGPGNYRGVNHIVTGGDQRFQAAMGTLLLNDTASDFSGYCVVGSRHSGTSFNGRINGVNTVPASVADITLNTPTTRGRIGASSELTATNLWLGKQAIHIVTKPLDTVRMFKLEGWLAWQRGLNARLDGSHPYRNVRP